jgi:endonuclease/exonuclease/phosphatase family metal-dependent hydrolase
MFTLATLNLCQWAAPGSYWYEAAAGSTYKAEEWTDKRNFLADLLAKAQADLVGFQEVFDTEDLRSFVAGLGYPHFAVIRPATKDPGNPAVWVSPVCALASRFPISNVMAVPGRSLTDRGPLLHADFTSTRDILSASVAVPGLALPLLVCVAHLKSQRYNPDKADVLVYGDWPTRFRTHIALRSDLMAMQMIRRTGEAAMLRAFIMDRLWANPGQAAILMGDMNSPPDSLPFGILTQNEAIGNIAGKKFDLLPDTDKRHLYDNLLYDAQRLGAQTTELPPTHTSFHGPSRLDYILFSNALNKKNDRAVAVLDKAWLIDDHFGEDLDSRRQSDHAAVVARFVSPAPAGS